MKYKRYALSDLVTIKYGKNQKKVLSDEGTIPIYGTGGLMGYATEALYSEPSVLIGRKGTIGKVKYINHPFWTVDTLFYTIVNTEIVIPKYLYYLMYQMDLNIYNEGTTIPSLRVETLNRLEFDIPLLEEQRKVLSYITPIDKKIDLNIAINDNLLEQSLSLFQEYYVNNSVSFDTLPLYDFADYINGAAFKPKELGYIGLPVIKIAELKAGITDSTQYFSGTKGAKYLVSNKDILFSWSGNPETSIDVFIWTAGKGILNQHTFNVRSKFNCRWFTYLLLKWHKPIFTQIASNKQTTGLGHVTVGDLRRLTFPFDLNKIQNFENMISPIMELYFNNLMENQSLATTRDTLLPKLMSGEIDVSNLDI